MADARPRPKLLYIITEDWFFASHFLPMARAAKAEGFDIAIACRVARHRAVLEAEGLKVIPVASVRGRNNPLALWRSRSEHARICREERPAAVHCISLKPLVVGGLAARRAGVPQAIFAITGLGHVWSSGSVKARWGRVVLRRLARQLRGPNTLFLFENHDDPQALGLDPEGARIAFVPGAGVDPEAFPAQPEPDGQLRLAMVGRMLWAKGVDTAVKAVLRARDRGIDVSLDLWGEPDADNPASVPEAQLRSWDAMPGIHWRGRSEDINAVWRDSHIAIAPSRYREGIPRAIVEGMASARPVITTDVPGCREAVRDGVEGLVVPKDDTDALADAIAALASDAQLRRRMGQAARARFEANYTEEIVTNTMRAIYREIAARSAPSAAER